MPGIYRPIAVRLSRRGALSLGSAALAGLVMNPWPAAAVTVDINQANVQPMPIAIADFVGGAASDNETAQAVSRIITNNLKRSGLFAPIDPAAFIEKIVNVDAVPRFADWRIINAQALATGRVTRQNDGRLKAEFRLWDVLAASRPNSGCGTCLPASSSPVSNITRRPTIGGVSPTSSRTLSTNA